MSGLLPPSVPSSINAKVSGNVKVSGNSGTGDVVTAELTPVVQVGFSNGANPSTISEQTDSSGYTSYSGGVGTVSSGASVGGKSKIRSAEIVKHRHGLGSAFRIEAMFDAPVIGADQLAGALCRDGNLVAFGFDQATGKFGALRRHSGVASIVSLQVTAAATGAETLSITLDGVLFSVPVVGLTVEDNANEIAEFAFGGWLAEAHEDEVHFIADTVGVRDGAYSLTSTGTATGTFAVNLAGAETEDDWTHREDWDVDRLDGGGPSSMDLDPSTLNVYQVTISSAEIAFAVKDPLSRSFQLVHVIRWANANSDTMLSVKDFFPGVQVENVTSSVDLSVSAVSLAGFVEGAERPLGPLLGVDTVVTADGGVETPVLSVRCDRTFISPAVAAENLKPLIPKLASASVTTTNKSVRICVIIGATLINPRWEHVLPGVSYASVDRSATARLGGIVVGAVSIPNDSNEAIDLTHLDGSVQAGSIITIAVVPTGNDADVVAALSWKEDI